MIRVLMVDDDRLQFRLVEQQLRSLGGGRYQLTWCETYETGLEQLLLGAYDACLMDFRLGAKDGLQLIREAAEKGCRTPIVFLTAESSEQVDLQAMEAGALDYLVKGEITPRALERSLRYATKLGETLEALRRMATRDELTGLLNRREYDRILMEEEERARRFGQPLSLVVIDLDHFKSVNDTHGHAAGDVVLAAAASRISAAVRTVDRALRIGGEEFALILVQTDRASALEVARRALAAVALEPVTVGDGTTIPMTASAGVAEMPTDALGATELYLAADRALYAAKQQGRNRAVAAEPRPGGP